MTKDRWRFTWVSQDTYQISLVMPDNVEIQVALVEIAEAELPKEYELSVTAADIAEYLVDAANLLDATTGVFRQIQCLQRHWLHKV